ncbi:hypothetical protein TRIATDRAFT_301007 [Trichoderma atroviride IMI 206040]|uniref:Uncharacterized protein n=1 Tax=Hypocrea atroviridis (strain ATCC 20476 / IMI 206040) TaxID=452589 RepID=G9P3S7_HYPAI|nr:uncharacterized protein TRIATDRAFT_301007 [Trichoderma atroviride IMI 206040]EHK43033.1 hypothetical protein TRIATDRAFT_301007 [Trichoderma atroviride IMI 206040]
MPYYIWTILRTMPPISFPIFPSLTLFALPVYIFIACSTINYSSILPPPGMAIFTSLSSNKPMAARWLAVYGMTNTVPFLIKTAHHSLAMLRPSQQTMTD